MQILQRVIGQALQALKHRKRRSYIPQQYQTTFHHSRALLTFLVHVIATLPLTISNIIAPLHPPNRLKIPFHNLRFSNSPLTYITNILPAVYPAAMD